MTPVTSGTWRVKSMKTVLDLAMIAPIPVQCIFFSYTIQADPEVEPHAPNTYQSILVPGGSINSNKCDPYLSHE